MRLSVYLSAPIMTDFRVICNAMLAMHEPGITDTEGNVVESSVAQRLIIRCREELKKTPSPEAGKSMWEYARDRSMLKEDISHGENNEYL